MDFRTALTTDDLLGENLMPTHSTSGEALVDMFFKMGASRQTPDYDLIRLYQNAIDEDMNLSTRAIFYNRDIRGGQGERRSFRIFYRYLCEAYPEIAKKNIPNVPYYGRWDDLFVTFDTPVEADAVDFILSALKGGDKLCAKWMPRENKADAKIAKKLMKTWELTPRQYRKLLAGNTQVVETKMCSNDWSEIKYSAVPSMAMTLYRRAFGRHDQERFADFLTRVEKGEEKIHADAVFPHTIVGAYGNLFYGLGASDQVLELQWKALPDYMPKGERILPVCDVSGSMNGLPILVSVALGIYLSERNEGPFKDMFITFSGQPTLQLLKGKTLRAKIVELVASQWQLNTNLEAVFNLILNKARSVNLPESEMPKTILILSDMQFDVCIRKPSDNSFKMLNRMYADAGYELPQVIFWNLRDSTGIPVKFDQQGTALVSGFSPSIMKNIMGGDITPIKIVLKTLLDKRYDSVVV